MNAKKKILAGIAVIAAAALMVVAGMGLAFFLNRDSETVAAEGPKTPAVPKTVAVKSPAAPQPVNQNTTGNTSNTGSSNGGSGGGNKTNDQGGSVKSPPKKSLVACPACGGVGSFFCVDCAGGWVVCPNCGGYGNVDCAKCNGQGIEIIGGDMAVTCTFCNGNRQLLCGDCGATGLVICPTCGGTTKKPCQNCGASGTITVESN